ncbi:MAG: S8 family peptidase [Anaerolineales bacterium]
MKHWKNYIQIFVSILLLIASFGPMFPLGNTPQNKLDPRLANLAENKPDQIVSVIIQQKSDDEDFGNKVASLKGIISGDLSIIKAVTVNLPAEAALRIAADPNVRWVSLNAPVVNTKRKTTKDDGGTNPSNYFLDTLGVRQVWDMGLQGQGITVAVIDSGINFEKDLQVEPTKAKPDSRLIEQLTFNSNAGQSNDATGHGTHVAGIIGGSGYISGGLYAGIAPQVNLISLKISDEAGMAYESDVIEAMQWVLENKEKYNIRVINLSINSTQESSYHASPLDAAAEILWFNGVVVVASVGNKDSGGGYNTANAAPANDPFIISVGASDEHATSDPFDDTISTFSSHTTTLDGFRKPEIVAPGTDIISILGPGNWISEYPDRVVMNGEYFRLSGTSMSAPMVAGAVALLLQDEPELTPDQVKYRLVDSARSIGGGYAYLDVHAAVTGTSSESQNTGIAASQLLWSGDDPVSWESIAWNSVAWNSVAWNSVAWNSVAWNSVAWNSVAWNSVYWGE